MSDLIYGSVDMWVEIDHDQPTLVRMCFGRTIPKKVIHYAVTVDYRDAQNYANKIFRGSMICKKMNQDTSSTRRLAGRLVDGNAIEEAIQKHRAPSAALFPLAARSKEATKT